MCLLLSAPAGAVVMITAALISGAPFQVTRLGWALAGGELASPAVYAGALLCLAAIGLVSMERARPGATSQRPARGLGYGVVAGIAFGMFFLFLRNAGAAGVVRPVAAARVVGTVTVLAAAAWLGTAPPGRAAGWRILLAATGSGVLDAAANVSYLLAAGPGCSGWRS